MAQKKTIKKSQVTAQIQENIKICEAQIQQIPYLQAQQRVKQLTDNPCLQGKFYLNALYKEIQTQDSEQEARDPKYVSQQNIQFTYEEIFNDPKIQAYLAIYKKTITKQIDSTKYQQATEKIKELKQQVKQKKITQVQFQEQKLNIIQENKNITEKTNQFVPLQFLGPYANYTAAQNAFKSLSLQTSKTTKSQPEKQLKIVGLLPEIHNISYITNQEIIYYIYLDFTQKFQELKNQLIDQYTQNSNYKTVNGENVQYISIYEGVNIDSTFPGDIFTQFEQAESVDQDISVHKTLKNNRQIYFPLKLYNVTKYLSETANKQMLQEQQNVVDLYKEITINTSVLNEKLKLVQKYENDSENAELRLSIITQIASIIGCKSNPQYQTALQYLKQNAYITDQHKAMEPYASYFNFVDNMNNSSSALDKLYFKLINKDYKFQQVIELNNKITSLTEQLKYMYLSRQSNKNAGLIDNAKDITMNIFSAETELDELKIQLNNLIKQSSNDIPTSLVQSAIMQYINNKKEEYSDAKDKATDAKEEYKDFMQNFVASQNKVVITISLRPKTIQHSFLFKNLASNNFKPELDKKIVEIKKQYNVQKIYQRDIETGKLLHPLVCAGQVYPDNWPYKQLYIDTLNYHEWMNRKDQLIAIKNKYLLLPDQIPVPDSEQPCIKQTFGSGTEIKVQKQPPPDPWCDKYFPKNYAQLFGVPNILPSLMNVEVLQFDEKHNPIMIDDPEGKKDVNGKIMQVQKTHKCPVSLQNGYAYVDTGIEFQLCYTILPLMPNLSICIPGVGMDYGSIIAGYFTPLDPRAAELIQKYPYQNTQANGRYWWMMCDSAAHIYKVLTGQPPMLIKFKIFLKYNIRCGYPKKQGKLTEKQCQLNGKCGLQQFLNKKIDIQETLQMFPREETRLSNTENIVTTLVNSASNLVDGAPQVLNLITATAGKYLDTNTVMKLKGMQNIANQAVEFKKQGLKAINNTWNIKKSIQQNDFIKNISLQSFTQIMQNMAPMLSNLLPPDCMKTICEAQREAQKEKCISSFSDSVKNNFEATKILVANVGQSVKNQLTNVISSMGAIGQTALQGAKNLVTTFNLYQLCARRFSDYLKDANPIGDASPIPLLNKNGFKIPTKLSLFSQLQNMIGETILNTFMGALNNCITKSLTKMQLQNLPGIPGSAKQLMTASLKSNDLIGINNILQTNGTDLSTVINSMNNKNNTSSSSSSNSSQTSTESSSQTTINETQQQLVQCNGIIMAKKDLDNATGLTKMKEQIAEQQKKKQDIIDKQAAISKHNTGSTADERNIEAIKSNKYIIAAGQTPITTQEDSIQKCDEKIQQIKENTKLGTFVPCQPVISNSNNTATTTTSNNITVSDVKNGFSTTSALQNKLTSTFDKSPAEIFSSMNDISTVIGTQMLEKSMRKMIANATIEQKSQQKNEMDEYITEKNNQLKRLNMV